MAGERDLVRHLSYDFRYQADQLYQMVKTGGAFRSLCNEVRHRTTYLQCYPSVSYLVLLNSAC
jgi:hypothetical protein